MAPLTGRVFSRLQQYATLHDELKDEVQALEVYLTAHQTEVFGLHHANLLKSVRSVRAKALVETIAAWIKDKDAPEDAVTPATAAEAAEDVATPATATTAETPAAVEAAPVVVTEEEAKKAKDEAAAAAKAAEEATAARVAHAKKLLEALVLKGFITPHKEQEKLPTTAAAATPETFTFKDSELFIPLASEVTEITTTTVWQVVDGAVFTAVLKRKAGFLAPLTQGKDVYVVVNEKLKSVTLFESDVGRHPIVHFEADGSSVSFDKTHFVHGIKVWNETVTELLNAATKLEREALVHALKNAGFTYHEEVLLDLEKIASIYELKDKDMDGQEVALDKYKGKVLLVVNVSSKCGLTPTNYPELVALDEKYRERGLEVLAFPCNQFMGQEPGSHDEIKEFVKQYNAQFAFFEKNDVNGVETRAVFAYLKAKLPSNYIQWNFTKFLVDRDGQPVKRFGPMELPLSLEDEIVALLDAEPTVVAAETPATEEAAENKAAEPEAAAEPVVAASAVEEVAPELATAEPEVVETKAEAPVVVEKTEAPVVTELSMDNQPAAVEETPAVPVVVAAEPEVKAAEPVTEIKTEEVVVETKVEAVAATPAVEEVVPQTKAAEVAAEAPSNEPAQGFTSGNEPTAP